MGNTSSIKETVRWLLTSVSQSPASSFLSINAGFQVKVNLLSNEGCVKYAQELGVGRRIWEMKRTPLVPPRQGLFWTRPEPSVLIYPALVRVLECLEALDSEVCPAQLFTFIYVYPLSLSLSFFFFFLPLGMWNLSFQTWYPTCMPCIESRES